MARVIGRRDEDARALLEAAGVRLHVGVGDPADAPDALCVAVMPGDSREPRGEVLVEVPIDVDAGMGAWHVNAVDELHVVRSGEGVMEFVTLDGVVSVLIGAGDVIEIRGAEHRYRPLSQQVWLLRFSGGPAAQLVATDTGRAAGPWPAT
jgi:mannose-6-phosphate isomerase-like protein (cupin superfamily)